jgi:hypothetical protein
MGENPSHHVFVHWDVEHQGDLLSDSRTAPVGITLLHFDDRMDELCTRSLRAGLPTAIRGEQQAVLLLAQGFVKAKQRRRLQNDCGTEPLQLYELEILAQYALHRAFEPSSFAAGSPMPPQTATAA